MEKPKVVIDYNSRMGAVDFSDAYLTSYHSTRRRLKKYCQKHFCHLIDICCLNLYLVYKNWWQHFQDGILSETCRKFNLKISYNRRKTIMQTTRNCPTDKDECSSLSSLLRCCYSVKAKSVSALCYVLQNGSAS
jgi:hypothetical protein